MTLDEMHDEMDRLAEGPSIEFESIDPWLRPFTRADLCAFALLDKLCPGSGDIVVGSEHDIIYLGVEPEELAKVVSKDHLKALHAFGVLIDRGECGLCMFT